MNKLTKLILPLLLIGSTFLNAQIIPFQKKFGGLDNERIWRVTSSSDGSFVGFGRIISGDNDDDVLITKFDIHGTIVSSWRLGQPSQRDRASGGITLADGSIIVMGHTRPYGNGLDNSFIYKFNPDGLIDWSRQFGDDNIRTYGAGIIKTTDNKILLIGVIVPPGSNEQATLIKMDINGSVIFQKQWDASLDQDVFQGVTEVFDGYVATGYSDVFDPEGSLVKPIVIKFDFNGNLIWSNIYDDGSMVHRNDIQVLSNSNNELFVAYGAGNSNSINAEDRDIIVMKLDANGSVIWSNRYGGPNAEDIDNMSFSNEGDLLINGDLIGLGFEERNGFIMRIKQNGDLERVNLYGKNGNDYINDIIKFTRDGCSGYMLIGSTSSFNANADESEDAWIIKTDDNLGVFEDCFTSSVPFSVQPTSIVPSSLGEVSDWNVTSTPNLILTSITMNTTTINCSPIEGDECVTKTSEIKPTESFLIFPNPNQGQFEIESEDITSIQHLQVFDIMGTTIPFTSTLIGNKYKVETKNSFKGLVFIHINSKQGLLVKKIIIN